MFSRLSRSKTETAPKAPVDPKAAAPSKPKQNAGQIGAKTPAAESATTVADKPREGKDEQIRRDRQDHWNELKTTIHRKLVDRLDLARMSGDDETIREQVREVVTALSEKENALLNFTERQRLIEEILDETFGLGPLEVLLQDPTISDILVNGPRRVYVESSGRLKLTDVQFKDDAHLMHVIDKIVSPIGRRCDEVSPMVDARLPDGSRVNAIIPPLAIDGPAMSIRRFGTDPITWDDYLGYKSCTPEMIEFIKACVHSRLNIIIVGGTGSGKTTLLNNCSSFIPKDERIVTIEDAAELQLRQPHVVRMESRPPNIEGKGRITIRDLLINSLRMRPDRIVVGECRGPETLDMLQAMNTGHDGSLTTIHANTTRDAVQRIETLVMMAGFELPVKAIRQQFASAVDLLVLVNRLTGGPRKLVTITEIQGMEGDMVTMQDIFKFVQEGIDSTGKAYGHFEATGIRPTFLERLKASGAQVDMDMFERCVLMSDKDEK